MSLSQLLPSSRRTSIVDGQECSQLNALLRSPFKATVSCDNNSTQTNNAKTAINTSLTTIGEQVAADSVPVNTTTYENSEVFGTNVQPQSYEQWSSALEDIQQCLPFIKNAFEENQKLQSENIRLNEENTKLKRFVHELIQLNHEILQRFNVLHKMVDNEAFGELQ